MIEGTGGPLGVLVLVGAGSALVTVASVFGCAAGHVSPSFPEQGPMKIHRIAVAALAIGTLLAGGTAAAEANISTNTPSSASTGQARRDAVACAAATVSSSVAAANASTAAAAAQADAASAAAALKTFIAATQAVPPNAAAEAAAATSAAAAEAAAVTSSTAAATAAATAATASTAAVKACAVPPVLTT